MSEAYLQSSYTDTESGCDRGYPRCAIRITELLYLCHRGYSYTEISLETS